MKQEEVILARCSSYENAEEVKQAIQTCVTGMGGLDWVRPGMKIAIKVNLIAGMAPEKAATTHPALLKALCDLLLERGASVVIGDSPGGTFSAGHVNAVYKACHLDELVRDGVSLNQDFSSQSVSFPEAVCIRRFECTSWLKNADAIINFAKFKTHAMMAMSCCVKNLFGAIPGVKKPEYHMRFPDPAAFANMMVDLNAYFKPVFCFVDAVVGMEGNGPTAGSPRPVGLVLAGTSPYAVDMICARLMNLGREDVPTLQAAWERGLGPETWETVTCSMDPASYVMPQYQLVTRRRDITFGQNTMLGRGLSGVMQWALGSRPQVRQAECVGCGQCAKVCPAGAITMTAAHSGNRMLQTGSAALRSRDAKRNQQMKQTREKSYPDIDREKCIHCFCCQEFCPKGAMKVHHNPLVRPFLS